MIIKKISWLCLLCISSASFATERDPSWLADYMAMRQLIELGDSAAKAEDWNAAASYYAKATSSSQAVPSKIGLWFAADAMRAYAMVGNAEALESIIKHSVGKGYGLSGFLENNSEFDEFRDRRGFEDSLKLIKRFDEQYEKDHSSPESAKLAFDDVPRFWRAYDLAKQENRKSAKAAIFRQHYLANGTAGAIEYHWIKTGSMERLVERIEKSPEFYDGIRAQTLKAASYEPKIREGFIALEKLYPDTYFPEVSFVIGRLNSGGTAGPSGMLIGLDVWSWTEGVSLDGVSPGFQTLLKENSLEKLPLVVIHEHIHAMQLYTESRYTVLRAALQEGTADFLAMMALPEAKAPNYFSWGYKNEARIWSRFKKEMNGTNTGDWVGNNGEDYGDDWHADLGYFVGAQIAKAYFEQAQDKQQAIKDLLNVSDSNSILVKSGYADRFNP